MLKILLIMSDCELSNKVFIATTGHRVLNRKIEIPSESLNEHWVFVKQ